MADLFIEFSAVVIVDVTFHSLPSILCSDSFVKFTVMSQLRFAKIQWLHDLILITSSESQFDRYERYIKFFCMLHCALYVKVTFYAYEPFLLLSFCLIYRCFGEEDKISAQQSCSVAAEGRKRVYKVRGHQRVRGHRHSGWGYRTSTRPSKGRLR